MRFMILSRVSVCCNVGSPPTSHEKLFYYHVLCPERNHQLISLRLFRFSMLQKVCCVSHTIIPLQNFCLPFLPPRFIILHQMAVIICALFAVYNRVKSTTAF
ncbi:hypothetical protein CAEBREN_30640 [Caenorhabditis brenneri]|uniref:Uncharacterized protein n=1 Tax=Caenorhabditis brenneri TaxID=135651 RepID=G0M6S7_CAEBE|nr:hypothetical protein CAEBREN_30640 [Caenorhabditis brenneri]